MSPEVDLIWATLESIRTSENGAIIDTLQTKLEGEEL